MEAVAPRLKSDSSVDLFPERRKQVERFHRTYQPRYVRDQSHVLRTTTQNAGTIRRLWHGLMGYMSAQAAFSWTRNESDIDNGPIDGPISTPLRYLISSLDVVTAGNQRSNPMRRSLVPPRVTHPGPALVMSGNVGYRPTVRSRVPSFGSRVPALNTVGGLGIAGTEE